MLLTQPETDLKNFITPKAGLLPKKHASVKVVNDTGRQRVLIATDTELEDYEASSGNEVSMEMAPEDFDALIAWLLPTDVDVVAPLNLITGDVLLPVGQGPKLIVHSCNDVGRWVGAFGYQMARRWPQVRSNYMAWFSGASAGVNQFGLGEVQVVQVNPDIAVVNLIGQRGIRQNENDPPSADMTALRVGLEKVRALAKARGATVHMPPLATARSGADWREVEQMIREELCEKGVGVNLYRWSPE